KRYGKRYELLGFADLRGDFIFLARALWSVSPVGKRAVPWSLPIVLKPQLARFALSSLLGL
ncbi:MAG TPA: hypothetical protein DCL75_20230, partial [Ktedonobacter sp.]|nr:hypothetical protein [Ktedonobacter sp.]